MFIKQISKSLEAAVLFGEIDIDKAETTLKKLSEGSGGAKLIQVCSAKNIVSPLQVFAAAEQTITSFENNTSFSDSTNLEFLCRVNAERQIEKAIRAAGLKKGRNVACLVVVSGIGKTKKQLSDIASKIGMKEKKIDLSKNANSAMKHFGITKAELKTLSDLKNPLEAAVIERIAMLNLSQ